LNPKAAGSSLPSYYASMALLMWYTLANSMQGAHREFPKGI
jgi:hypothetical protein